MNNYQYSLPISALQHWAFCPRQCALIHVERLWEENRFTAEGRILHECVDEGRAENQRGVRILRSVQLASLKLLIHGVADVVEIHDTQPYPVEYKRGRPKHHRADEIQLCAQAYCLEEMMGVQIPKGSIFYGQNRRRTEVVFDIHLRVLTERMVAEMHGIISEGILPDPDYGPVKCESCSLFELCNPRSKRENAQMWTRKHITRAGIPE